MEGDNPTLRTFNNYTIIMTNNSDKMRIFLSVVFLLLLLFFELIHQTALVNFILFLNILKISFWIFWRKNCVSFDLRALFSQKPCKTFRTAQFKQSRLVKPCSNSDLYFISKTSGTALLETNVSYKLLRSLSQEIRKTIIPALLDISTT